MPLMWIVFGIQQVSWEKMRVARSAGVHSRRPSKTRANTSPYTQVDKTGLATQATFGIRADTHLVGNQYAWLTTIFFIAVSRSPACSLAGG